MQSAELTEFYRAYTKWLDEGAPANKPFWQRAGLCGSIGDFYDWQDLTNALLNEMQQQFVTAGLHKKYPFNEGSFDSYSRESHSYSLYQNTKRIQWVRDHCNV